MDGKVCDEFLLTVPPILLLQRLKPQVNLISRPSWLLFIVHLGENSLNSRAKTKDNKVKYLDSPGLIL